MVDNWPYERSISKSSAKLEVSPNKHELGEDQGLYYRNAPYCDIYAHVTQNGALQQHYRANAYVKIKGESQGFLDRASNLLKKRCRSRGRIFHSVSPQHRQKFSRVNPVFPSAAVVRRDGVLAPARLVKFGPPARSCGGGSGD